MTRSGSTKVSLHGLEFEWDERKAEANLKKHGVSFFEAASAFLDELGLVIADPDHSEEENRFVLVGQSVYGRVLVVVHVERGVRLRIISARQATRREREDYEGGE